MLSSRYPLLPLPPLQIEQDLLFQKSSPVRHGWICCPERSFVKEHEDKRPHWFLQYDN
jgi:hypothetical protein